MMTTFPRTGDASELAQRRKAAGDAAGCLDLPMVAFLVLWSAFVTTFTAIALISMIRHAMKGVFGGQDIVGLLAMLIFDIPMVLGWWLVIAAIKARRNPSEAGALWVVENRTSVELREYALEPVFVGLIAVFAADFALMFVVAFGFQGQTPLPAALAACGALVLAFLGGARWWKGRVVRSDPLLKLDRVSEAVTFRTTNRDDAPITVQAAKIRAVDLDEQQITKGDSPYTKYVVRLHVAGEPPVTSCYPLVVIHSELAARLCVRWLRKHLGIP